MPFNLKRTLIAARALIAKGWCQSANATTRNGFVTHVGNKHAVRFCMSGALLRACGPMKFANHQQALNALSAEIKTLSAGLLPSVTLFNDAPTRTKDDVLLVFDNAIAHA